jgi:phage tail protein X
VRAAQGDLPGALEVYEEGQAIHFKLVAADPGNAAWQRDLAVSWSKLGEVRVAQGNLAGAVAAYKASQAIAERLAAADPGNAGWQRNLIVSHVKLSEVAASADDARRQLAAALRIARAQEAAGRLAPVDAWIPAALEERLADLDE